MSNLKLELKTNGREYNVNLELSSIKLEELVKGIQNDAKGYITLGVIDNKLRELSYEVTSDCKIRFLDTTNTDGIRVYGRTTSFIFVMACKELFKDVRVTVEHSLANGIYCELHMDKILEEKDVEAIKDKMNEIINNNYDIEKITITKEEAEDIFNKENMHDRAQLLKYKEYDDVKLYKCRGHIDHFYGYMLPSTGHIKVFDLKLYKGGVVLLGPRDDDKSRAKELKPQEKLANIYNEAEQWSNLMGIDNVLSLNELIENGNYGDMIRTVEALHEKKLSQIADTIKENGKRIILIAAPSSSGKTSFAHRLSIHLRVNNLKPVSISLDDYFVDREDTPLDEFGNYDFESIYAIDLETFNSDLKKLLDGEEIKVPKFNFKTGKREYLGKTLKISSDQPIILEGIHGLNPMLTSSIPDEDKFKIYISALTQINLDDHNRIPTTDLRLIRRMVRDFNFRGYSAERTITQWESVRRGERKNIFPYQEEADMIFNSACVYELSVLKCYAKPLLEQIDQTNPIYIEANRLLKFLQYFVELKDTSDIPPTSILREFIGGSKIVD